MMKFYALILVASLFASGAVAKIYKTQNSMSAMSTDWNESICYTEATKLAKKLPLAIDAAIGYTESVLASRAMYQDEPSTEIVGGKPALYWVLVSLQNRVRDESYLASSVECENLVEIVYGLSVPMPTSFDVDVLDVSRFFADLITSRIAAYKQVQNIE